MSADEFDEKYVRAEGQNLTAEASGEVQGAVEEQLLADLNEQLGKLRATLPPGAVILIENEAGVDHPKTRGRQTNTIVGNENRLMFQFTIDPPLRVGVYRTR